MAIGKQEEEELAKQERARSEIIGVAKMEKINTLEVESSVTKYITGVTNDNN